MGRPKPERVVKERRGNSSNASSVNNDHERENVRPTSKTGHSGQASSLSTGHGNPSPRYLSQPARYDGNRDPTPPQSGRRGAQDGVVALRVYRNIDGGARNSYLLSGHAPPLNVPLRPSQMNPTGRPGTVSLNNWIVPGLPSKTVFQYDVQVGRGVEKRGLIEKVWRSKTAAENLGKGWIFDGNRIAYWHTRLDEVKEFEVDLDAEQNRPNKSDKNKHIVTVRFAKQVPMQNLQGFLNGQSDWDNNCLESMAFLDHLLRETPSRQLSRIKRMFYHPAPERNTLGGGLIHQKGVYAAIHPVQYQGKSASMSVNVDVANGAFWNPTRLHHVVQQLLDADTLPGLVVTLRIKNNVPTPEFNSLRRLKRVGVICSHRPGTSRENPDRYVIDRFLRETATTRKAKFKVHDFSPERELTIEEYFLRKYNVKLQYPDLPLVQMTKGSNTVLPMELCSVDTNQRCNFKLDPKQTENMIKHAVTLPKQRWEDIETGIGWLDWSQDSYHAAYGFHLSREHATAKVKILPPPKVCFAKNQMAEPGTSGRWDLRGKRFLVTNPQPLDYWGVSILPGRSAPALDAVQRWIADFIRTARGHGVNITCEKPLIQAASVKSNAGEAVETLWKATGDHFQKRPQFLMFIVPYKNVDMYKRIKKSADCRYGVVSQVLQSKFITGKPNPQYCSNVSMKVNAKLGGFTARSVGIRGVPGFITKPTMFIGADVTHGSTGEGSASIAAVTVSWDKQGLRYAAAVETNGSRQEIIKPETWNATLKPVATQWIKTIGGNQPPQHVFYFRDGVSEGEYAKIVTDELQEVKRIMNEVSPNGDPGIKYTVVICTKRHHIRMFPDKNSGDRNGNPLPGTLLETAATHPREYDFYLVAHAAIKGTARPAHYYVLHDDAKLRQEDLQNMIYEASYQYVRSTTPVSLFPAIYYAHLAAARALSHINAPSQVGGEKGTRTNTEDPEVKALIPMPNITGIWGTMWYV